MFHRKLSALSKCFHFKNIFGIGTSDIAAPLSPGVGKLEVNWFRGNGREFENEIGVVDVDGYFLQWLSADVRLFLAWWMRVSCIVNNIIPGMEFIQSKSYCAISVDRKCVFNYHLQCIVWPLLCETVTAVERRGNSSIISSEFWLLFILNRQKLRTFM